jgi:death-on-curing protein
MEPIFLTIQQVERIHENQIETLGGKPGTRDKGLLESAVAQAKAGVAGNYLHKDLYEMSAAYLFHIAQNQAFYDGNKRTAFLAAYIFLYMNGILLETTQNEAHELMQKVAAKKATKIQAANFLRKFSKPLVIPP